MFVDQQRVPILPDMQAGNSHVDSGANELTFTYDSPAYPWSAGEMSALLSAQNAFYPVIKDIYGAPAFNITVNVRKDPGITFAGLYYPSFNEIVIRDVSSLDTFCHETIHAFRDDNVTGLGSFEEGMTRAAEVEVFNRLPAYTHWDENHSYTYDVYYEALNQEAIGSPFGNFFAGYTSVLLRYQLAGYAWGKALLENSRFLRDFNKALYEDTLSDPSTPLTESKLLAIADRVQSKVEATPFAVWYGRQCVFHTAPPVGYFLYQRINQFTADFFQRNIVGGEVVQASAPVQWAVYDFQDALLSSGVESTTGNGWLDIIWAVPAGYMGRIKVVVTASTPNGTISSTALRSIGNEAGVFGVVSDVAFGEITITSIDHRAPTVTASVWNGAFSAPSLAAAKGRFRAVFRDAGGRRLSKYFTKDASNYFLLISP
ncbi:MAG: hypothetical protein DMG07_27555 [Acidobacteria bacterium]|nr:MAG: hypothetical protein DMG07_27555 [Acidobacteriota bacterium]